MANRHKFKKGGRVAYDAANSNVVHEAEEHKRGGKVVGKTAGHKGKHRYARGGKAGSDKHPFSSAHRE